MSLLRFGFLFCDDEHRIFSLLSFQNWNTIFECWFGCLCDQTIEYQRLLFRVIRLWIDEVLYEFFLFLDHYFEALSEMKRLKEETDQKTRKKGEICSHILEKQRKISSMESDSANLAQVFKLLYVSHEAER